MNQFFGLLASTAVSLSYVFFLRWLVSRHLLSSSLSRKLLHIFIGPLYIACWNFYDDDARWVAAIVPGSITAAFIAVGLSLVRDENLVKTMSRSGSASELLRGPALYGVAHVALTVLFWNTHPAGVISLCALCGGDGLAELSGKLLPIGVIPWSRGRKSIGGSIAFVAGSFSLALVVLPVSGVPGWVPISLAGLSKLLAICITSAIVESLPFPDIDNATVPAVSAFLSMILW